MKYIYAPWRWKYIKRAIKGEKTCIFCDALKKEDDEAFILYRGEKNLIMMNIYPYNNGHIMIAPKEHIRTPADAPLEVMYEMSFLIQASLRALGILFSPHGFNIGMNVGRTAGAGVVEHFHLHIVPRWEGDSNFVSVFSDTKIVAMDVKTVYQRLKPVLLKEINLIKKD